MHWALSFENAFFSLFIYIYIFFSLLWSSTPERATNPIKVNKNRENMEVGRCRNIFVYTSIAFFLFFFFLLPPSALI